MFVITYLDMCENTLYLSDELLPTQDLHGAQRFEVRWRAERALKECRAERDPQSATQLCTRGDLFYHTAHVEELPDAPR